MSLVFLVRPCIQAKPIILARLRRLLALGPPNVTETAVSSSTHVKDLPARRSDADALAKRLLDQARVHFQGRCIGTMAAVGSHQPELNYRQIFVRDFAVSAAAFLLDDEPTIVRNFLETTLSLQSVADTFDCLEPGRGLMPASFRPAGEPGSVHLDPDYGEESIARVTPVDSMFWWVIVLGWYVRATGDRGLAERADFQQGIQLTLAMALDSRMDLFPTLLAPEGAFMIDRRLGVYGHPLEIQCLFALALEVSEELLAPDHPIRPAVARRRRRLAEHLRRYYWIDAKRLDELRSNGYDQYGEDIDNAFNLSSESIPDWVDDWLPSGCGYFAGNLGPGRLDFRFFTQGNLLAVAAGVADASRRDALLNLIETRWDCLVADMPLKLVYPAVEGKHWSITTGADSRNKPWSYHNGGSWPFLLWTYTAVALSYGREESARKAVDLAERRLADDDWPEFYEGENGSRPGELARRKQVWSAAGYVVAKRLIDKPDRLCIFCPR